MKIKITSNPELANAITHDGVFHADDVLAAVILAKTFGELILCRTSKVPENINPNTIVFDIGHGEYDHHQKGGNGSRRNGIPYAAAGLIWKKFGNNLVKNTFNPSFVWNYVDRTLIAGVDAKDNNAIPRVNYPTQGTNLNTIIFQFNPSWDSEKSFDEAFLEAFDFVEKAFDKTFELAKSTAKAEKLVEKKIESSNSNIMILDTYLPCIDFINNSTNSKAANIEFIIYPSRNIYTVLCVPRPKTKILKCPLPMSWRGLEREELQKETGIDTATFCHPEGFICGAEKLEDAIKLCKTASSERMV